MFLLDFFHDVSAWSKPSSDGALASAGQAGCDIERQPACPALASTPPDEGLNQAGTS